MIKKCIICGKNFEVIPYRKDAKFCSRACYNKSRIGKIKGNEIKLYSNYALLIVNSKKYKKVKFIIDKESIDLIKKYTWCITTNKYGGLYAMTKQNNKNLRLHRLIMNCPQNMEIDHINHNTLDNRKQNLRICTSYENKQNLGLRSNIQFKYIRQTKNIKGIFNGYAINIYRNGLKFNKHCLSLEDAISIRNKYLQNNYQKLNISFTHLQEIINQS